MRKETEQPYLENLDGLRFIGFLSIFFFHSFYTEQQFLADTELYVFIKWSLFGNGNLGVNFFFVLSGFLITRALVNEMSTTGQIRIKKFYLKKALRIWPLFLFCIFFGFIVFPLAKSFLGHAPSETANPWMYFFFVNNFDIINHGLPDASVLGVLWCIAVEAQFYLVWPLLFMVVPPRFYILTFGIFITLSAMFRMYFDGRFFFEFHSLSCLGDLSTGAMGAVLTTRQKFMGWIQKLPRIVIVGVYTIAILLYFFRDEMMMSNIWLRGIERPLISALFLLIILEQCFSKESFYKIGRYKVLSSLGTISYGLYCLHFIGILTATTIFRVFSIDWGLWQVLLLETALALMISIILAKFSFRFFEKPFLEMKSRIEITTARN